MVLWANRLVRPSTASITAPMIDEEHNRTDELTDAEYKAIASLSDIYPNVTLEDIIRAE